jgi:hypothetical protein
MRSEQTADLVKDAVGMVQDQMVGQTKDDKAGGGKPSIATAVAQGPWEAKRAIGHDDERGGVIDVASLGGRALALPAFVAGRGARARRPPGFELQHRGSARKRYGHGSVLWYGQQIAAALLSSVE